VSAIHKSPSRIRKRCTLVLDDVSVFMPSSERPNIDLAKLIGPTDPIYLLDLLVNCTIITINGC